MSQEQDLAAWRARRAAELQGELGVPGGPQGGGGGGGAAPTPQQQQQQQQQQAAAEEQRRLMLKQILAPAAAERLANVRLVKPEKARQLEDWVIGAARAGRLAGVVSEEQLKGFLEDLSEEDDGAD